MPPPGMVAACNRCRQLRGSSHSGSGSGMCALIERNHCSTMVGEPDLDHCKLYRNMLAAAALPSWDPTPAVVTPTDSGSAPTLSCFGTLERAGGGRISFQSRLYDQRQRRGVFSAIAGGVHCAVALWCRPSNKSLPSFVSALNFRIRDRIQNRNSRNAIRNARCTKLQAVHGAECCVCLAEIIHRIVEAYMAASTRDSYKLPPSVMTTFEASLSASPPPVQCDCPTSRMRPTGAQKPAQQSRHWSACCSEDVALVTWLPHPLPAAVPENPPV